MILKDRVSVKRYVDDTSSPSGAVRQVLKMVIESVACDLQPDKGMVVIPSQGQTAIYYKTMFCYRNDIRANDIITDLTTGDKMKVINTNDYKILPHMEIKLQGGTVK